VGLGTEHVPEGQPNQLLRDHTRLQESAAGGEDVAVLTIKHAHRAAGQRVGNGAEELIR
jgi:hypothetical protein